MLTLVAGPGCTRHYFRQRADKDVEGIITQKNIFPDWQVRNWHVYPDARARFASPSNPDRPPYPPDDYAARLLSPNPQRPTKKSGVGRTDGEGYLSLLEKWDAENRAWDPLPPARGTAPQSAAQTAPAAAPLPPPTVVRQVVPSVKPAAPAVAKDDGTTEFGPWVGTGRVPRRVQIVERNGQAAITALPPPVVQVAANEGEAAGVVLPAGGQPPVVPPPEKLPEPLPPPMPLEPKPVGPGGPVPTATGDPAADYLRALESDLVGYRLKLDQAIELGLLNAREFQDRREDLYLAALPVTLARFNFAAQAFFTEQAVRQSTGRDLVNGGERWTLNTTTGVSKLFPTGALLMVRLANQVVIDLSGDRPQTSISNLSLSLVQPFLRGGGLAVTLENLTANERNLLYAMRSYARFRKVFYVALAAGGGYTNNPYGLQGLSPNLGRGIGGNLTAPSTGYLPLLLQQATINNQRRNVAALEGLLRLFQAYREGGQIAPLQVDQVEVQLLNGRVQLLGTANGTNGIRGYLDALDNYKLQLGLPITVPLDLDDGPLKPIREQLIRFDEVYAQVRAVEQAAAQYDRTRPVADFRQWWLTQFTASPLVRGTPFAGRIAERWKTWWPDQLTADQVRARLSALRAERGKLLDDRVRRELAKQPVLPAAVARQVALEVDIDLGEFELRVREYEAQPWANGVGAARAAAQATAFTAAYNAFYLVILEARNDRLAALYRNWPRLAPLPVGGVDVLNTTLDEAYTAAIQTALTQRFDLMNARGLVVDAWRQIAVTANSLQGTFDVRYDLNSSTPAGGNNPLAFSGSRNVNQLTFRADLPLVRRAERNNYRASLIGYQRQRRTLMAFEDNIANDVRSDVRGLRTLGELYRIQQRLVELGYSQVDNAQVTQFAPLAAGEVLNAAASAALTQQVLQTQSSLVNAQNGLYQIWVAYLIARMNFYLDIEQLPLDDRGVWIDEHDIRTDDQPGADARPAGERLHPPRPVGEGR